MLTNEIILTEERKEFCQLADGAKQQTACQLLGSWGLQLFVNLETLLKIFADMESSLLDGIYNFYHPEKKLSSKKTLDRPDSS